MLAPMRIRTFPAILAAAALLLAACTESTMPLPPPGETTSPATNSSDQPLPSSTPASVPSGDAATVTRVIDGDTIDVELRGRTVRVRIIGVDTPETKDPRRGVQCYGREASAFTTKLLLGKRVVLVYDLERLDRYGRTLAYVYLIDATFVNLELVRLGYAQTLTIPPNVAHADEFTGAQRSARAAGLGLWNPATCP